mmetsp:Transcript_34657/g.103974  ORF Transcript_34657/g.103974 Transcript_34657/m.103974 type:complete len:270 (-) Transcript_34657:628-1437(-)
MSELRRFHRLRTASSVRPDSCLAMLRQRPPFDTTSRTISSSSSLLQSFFGSNGCPVWKSNSTAVHLCPFFGAPHRLHLYRWRPVPFGGGVSIGGSVNISFSLAGTSALAAASAIRRCCIMRWCWCKRRSRCFLWRARGRVRESNWCPRDRHRHRAAHLLYGQRPAAYHALAARLQSFDRNRRCGRGRRHRRSRRHAVRHSLASVHRVRSNLSARRRGGVVVRLSRHCARVRVARNRAHWCRCHLGGGEPHCRPGASALVAWLHCLLFRR